VHRSIHRFMVLRLLFIGACSVGAPLQANSEELAFSVTRADAGPKAEGLAVGDVNGDRRLDAVVTNFDSGVITILAGNGKGRFDALTTFSTGGNPAAVDLADFDEDGSLDVAAIVWQTATTGALKIFKGDGAGNFSIIQDIPIGHGSSLLISDLDRDGHTDILVTLYLDGKLVILYGDGSFLYGGVRSDIDAGQSPYAVAVGDLNEDGLSDIVVSNYVVGASAVSVMLGVADRRFGERVSYPAGNGATAVLVFDANGDGAVDIIASDATSGNIAVLANAGVGTLAAPEFFSIAKVGALTFSLAASDLNNDGVLDVVAANAGTASVSVALGRPTGGFESPQEILSVATPRRVLIADVNRDGRKDVLVISDVAISNTLSILTNSGQRKRPRQPGLI
jgi:hypothetical protein